MNTTQEKEVLNCLENGINLTQKYAITNFYNPCYRLAARICDLRAAGHQIDTTIRKYKSTRTGRMVRYAAYTLIKRTK